MSDACRSAYGLNFVGLGAPPDLLGDPLPQAPTITVRWHVDGSVPLVAVTELDADADRAVVRHPVGVRIELDRVRRTADFHGREVPDDQRAHPLLSPVAILHNRWLGRETFHAGVAQLHGRAWVIVGLREAGKSTFVAALAARGIPVLADDVAVTDGRDVFRGPRCIDLRDVPPAQAGHDLAGVTARNGSRFRLRLPRAEAAVPLGGWVALRWSAELSVRRLAGRHVMEMLARRRLGRAVTSDPTLLLNLAQRPALLLQRPRDWLQADASVEALLAAVEGVATAPDPR